MKNLCWVSLYLSISRYCRTTNPLLQLDKDSRLTVQPNLRTDKRQQNLAIY